MWIIFPNKDQNELLLELLNSKTKNQVKTLLED